MNSISPVRVASFFLLAFLQTISLHAQVSYYKRAGGSIIQSPEPSTLPSVAGVDNVDHNSGTVNVNVPLFEIVSNDIRVPISISYAAVGLKVDQRAGPVGMGWELNAGGGIRTIVNGLPDNTSLGLSNGYNPMLALPNSGAGLNIESNTTHRNYAIDVMEGKADGAWDAYVYSLPGRSGKFMTPRHTLLTFPFEPNMKSYSGGYVFGDGLKYEFETGDGKRMKSRTFYTEVYPPDVPQFTEAWKPASYDYYDRNLSRITSIKSLDTVSFSYEIINNGTTHGPTLGRLSAKESITTTVSMPVSIDVQKNMYDQWALKHPISYMIKEPNVSQSKVEVIQHTRIKRIDFKEGRVVFNYGDDYNGSDVLTSVRVERKNGNAYVLSEEFEFIYQSFYGHYLQGIRAKDDAGNLKYGWEFAYNQMMPVSPSSEILAQDRWGFYNGQWGNTTLIESPHDNIAFTNKLRHPVYNEEGAPFGNTLYLPRNSREARHIQGGGYDNPALPYKVNFANRNFNFNEAIKGTLKSVVTPTGALVEYEYEAHRFPHYYRTSGGGTSTQTIHGGGIRIKVITHRGKVDGKLLLQREFKYGTGNYLSPNASYVEDGLGYVSYPGTVLTNNAVYGSSGSSQTFQNLVFLSHPVNEMSQSGASYAAYPSVSEYVVKDSSLTGNDKFSARTTYFFPVPSLDAWQTGGGPDYFNFGGVNVKPGVRFDVFHTKPSAVIKWRDLSIKAEETIYAYKRFTAPPLSEPRDAHSFFTGITGSLLTPYMSASFFVSVSIFVPGQGFVNQTMDLGSLPIVMDPLYANYIYRENSATYFPGKYYNGVYDMNDYSDVYKLDTVRTVTYSDNSSQPIQASTTRYLYGNKSHLQPTYEGVLNSVGDSIINRIRYAQDYPTAPAPFVQTMRTNNLTLEPVEKISSFKRNNQEWVTSATANWYGTIAGPYFNLAKMTALNTDGKPVLATAYTGINDARHETRVTFDQYDSRNNLLQYGNHLDSKSSQIWGYGQSRVIAKVEGAALADIAYAGFESGDKGNWSYAGSAVTNAGSATGKAAYSLSSGAISKSQLGSSTTYVVSYWSKEGGTVSVTGGTVSPEAVLKVAGLWRLVERNVSGATAVSISGTATIDDVRLHPVHAQMVTYTYEPLLGITSITDPKGKREFYHYDAANRLSQIRDQDNNIIKQIRYNLYNGERYVDNY